MFFKIVSFAVRNRLLVIAAALALIVAGNMLLPKIPIDVFPDLNRPTVTVMTETDGLAPEEIERNVTLPIENALRGAPGVQRIRSTSSVTFSIIYVEFDWNVDIYRARQTVSERLSIAAQSIPPTARPSLGAISAIMGEVAIIGIGGPKASSMEGRDFADWVVRPRILSIPGISQVTVLGGELRELHVVPDLAAMRRLGITLDALNQALIRFGSNTGGGFVEQQGTELLIRNLATSARPELIRRLIVGYAEQKPVELGDIADVAFGSRPKRGDGSVMGTPGVLVAVLKAPQGDTLPLTRQIESVVADLSTRAPEGMNLQLVYRQADFTEISISNVQRTLIEAGVVVSVVLLLILMNARITIITLVAIPISMFVTAMVFYALGMTINTMTLGGLAIAIGELVDDAIVDVENIFRRLRINKAQGEPLSVQSVVVLASQEVRSSIVLATAIIILVFLPLLALGGIEGRLMTPLIIAYVVSILASLVTAITVTPVLSYYLLPGALHIHREDGLIARKIKSAYESGIRKVLRRPGPFIAGVTIAFTLAVVSIQYLPRSFLGLLNEGTYLVSVTVEPGTALTESSRIGSIAERLVLQVPEILTVARRTGRAEIQVNIDYNRAALYGVRPSEVTDALERLTIGQKVSKLYTGDRWFDLIIRLRDEDRTIEALSRLMIDTPKGPVGLTNLATIKLVDGANQISHENGRRRIIISANSDGSDMAVIIRQLREVIAAQKLPPGYFFVLEGTYKAQEEAASMLAILSTISLGLIFVLLNQRYNSSIIALIIMANVPLSLIGSVAALWIFGLPISVSSMVGFITLTGISSRNGILKVSTYITMIARGAPFTDETIIRGSLDRVAPVVLTALSAGCALIPLMFGVGEPGTEILSPVAITIVGGLISATLLDALLTPVLFKYFGPSAVRNLIRNDQLQSAGELETKELVG
ncbi:MAG: efflux RND transporter permease subunit [Alphaproteobacteria bacterium]|nr:efflux RND transporter permease subunit [Alphaproteobacteria bacterium]